MASCIAHAWLLLICISTGSNSSSNSKTVISIAPPTIHVKTDGAYNGDDSNDDNDNDNEDDNDNNKNIDKIIVIIVVSIRSYLT